MDLDHARQAQSRFTLPPPPLWANAVAALSRRLLFGRSRFIEWLCRGVETRFVARMPPELGGCQFECSLEDRLAREIFFSGCFFPQEIAVLRHVLKPGMSFVDIGAHWGLFTLVGAHLVGSLGKVAAVEPDPRMFAKLDANVRRNGFSQVHALELAIAEREREELLAAGDLAPGSWQVSRLGRPYAPHRASFKVRCKPLDDLLDETGFDRVDLLKVDVEGAEDLVLEGMATGLSRRRYRCILLELHPAELADRSRSGGALADILMRNGYRGYTFDETDEGMRKSYYHPWLAISAFIQPLNLEIADSLRHTVWVAMEEPGWR
jgi:FkbM family methyltransferase